MPNNELPIYKNVKHRGIYRFDKSKIYQVKYVVGDIEGNESVLTFHIKGNNDGVSFIPKIPFITKNETIMRWDSHNVFKREGILIEIPKKHYSIRFTLSFQLINLKTVVFLRFIISMILILRS